VGIIRYRWRNSACGYPELETCEEEEEKKDLIVVTQYSDVIMYKKCITYADINVKRQDKCSSIERGNVILAIDL